MNTGQVIKDILEKTGKKQNWLAKELNISTGTLSAMLKSDLKSLMLFRICEILQISIEEVYKEYLIKKEMSSATDRKSVV